jgi:hypothetical protein
MTSIWNVVQEVGVDVMKKKLEPVESYCVAVGISGDQKLSYNGVHIQSSVLFMRSIESVV